MPELPIVAPALTFAVVMGLVLVVPLLSERVRLPGVVGLILAGALVGPHGLGLFVREGTFELLGGVGLLYLMFTAGLSIDLQQFARVRGRSVAFGVVSFLLPLLGAVVLAGPLLGYDLWTALLLGAIVGSHTLVAYPVVARLGLSRTPAVTLTMGATMVTDVLSLVLLAVVEARAAGGGGAGFWLEFALGVALFGAFVGIAVPRLGRWFFRTVDRGPDVAFVFLLALVFLTAHLASVARLAPIIGAFMAGLALNRLVPDPSALMTRVKAAGETLFIPFFLLSVGMLVDGEALVTSARLWGMAAFFVALVLVGKTTAALVMARRFGQSRAAAWTMVGLTLPQAAATLAVTLIGFDLGLFDEDAVNAVVVTILVTCLVGAALAERFGRQMAEAEADAPLADAPQRLLVPLANPDTAEALTGLALLLRDPAPAEPLHVLAVAAAGPGEAARVAAAEALVDHASEHVAAADVPFRGLVRVDTRVPAGIERAVREERISAVVIGWNGRASEAVGAVFGTVLDELLDRVAAAVFVYRAAAPLATTRRLVVLSAPYADRVAGHAALDALIGGLASRLGVEVVALPLPDTLDTLRFALDPGDALVLVSARYGHVAWTPALRTLPRRLATAFPDVPLVIAYPPERPSTLPEGLGIALPG